MGTKLVPLVTLSTDNAVAPLTTMAASSRRLRRHVVVMAPLLLLAAALRLYGLGSLPFWVDEAESGINALTILDHGYPSDTFLGQPIYENTLTIPWPENAEYEFHDASYSKGLAVYHGWLPLYAIALAYRAFGIRPPNPGELRPQYDARERKLRTVVARMPAVFFGLLSLIGLYISGARLHSREIGLLAVLMAVFLALHIRYSQQARYYGATLACTSFCCWSVLRVLRETRWRDFLIAALCFTALFYTHILSFAVMVTMLPVALLTVGRRRSRQYLPKLLLFLAILALACIPWLLVTDFVAHSRQLPKAWSLMQLPRDLIIKRILGSEYGVLLTAAFGLLCLERLKRRSVLLQRAMRSFHPKRRAWVFLYAWLCVGYVAFLALIPAASFALGRLVLILLIPALLILAIIFWELGAAVSPKHSRIVAVATALMFVGLSNYLQPSPDDRDEYQAMQDVDSVVEYLDGLALRPDTRLFATPNEHLVLTFYTGLPVQSIAPIRKSFLDSYAGDVIFFEKVDFAPTEEISPAALRANAAARRHDLDTTAAEQLSWELASLKYRRNAAARVRRVQPPIAPVPAFALEPFRRHDSECQQLERRSNEIVHRRSPFFGDLFVGTIADWWNGFFYRFVDPLWREKHPNFENRIRNAELTILRRANWAVFASPGSPRGLQSDGDSNGVHRTPPVINGQMVLSPVR
jgi:hypothetical protein